jgi:phenylacetate-CoA ligase
MKLYHMIYQEGFFRTLDLLRGRQNIKRLKFLRKSQFWEKRQLEEWQLAKLNLLLYQASRYSSFYSSGLNHLKLPLKNLKEIESIQIIRKDDIRHRFNEILCENVNKSDLELSRTGGSTGEPSYYYLDAISKDWNRGSVYRSAEWAGVYLGDHTVMMMGSHYDHQEFQKLKNKFTLFLQRYKDYSVAYINDALLDKYFQGINRFLPTSIWGYASGLYIFAKFIKENYPSSRLDFVKAIITSSETLQPQWRDQINAVFGDKKVYDHYGSREMYIASECREHCGYHIHAENILLEIVDKQGNPLPPGQLGRIIVTDLTNLAFPFIRYEIGDIGVMSERQICSCGITLPILEKIEGRLGDVIFLKNRVLTSPNFTILMSDLEGVESYQIIQESINKLHIKIVKNSKFTSNVEEYLLNSLKELTGGEIDIYIDPVKEIDVPESGKHRFVISKMSSSYI